MYAELIYTPDPAQQQYVERLFSHLEWSVATPRVLAIGAGAVQDAYHYSEAYGFSRLQIDCINFEQGVVDYAIGAERVATRPIAPTQDALQRQYHLIWAADLFDSLDDALFQRTLIYLVEALALGGELVIGSSLSAGRLWTLAGAAGIPATAMTIRRGPDGTKLFLHIHLKQPASIGFAAQRASSVVYLN